MRVIDFRVRNFMGLRELICEPGKITVFVGENGTGKSSALEAAKNLFGGGSISTLRNINAPEDEPSEIVAVLETDEGEFSLKKNESSVTVKKRIGESVAWEKIDKSPQAWINLLTDKQTLNPLAFCDASDKDRVTMVLEALDLPFDRDELFKSIGLNREDFPAVRDFQHPLREIADHRKNIFERRTSINVSEKSKASAADELKRLIPAEEPDISQIDEKQAELDALREKIATERRAAADETRRLKVVEQSVVLAKEEQLKSGLVLYESELETKFFSIKSEIDAEIAEIYAETERKVSALREEISKTKETNSDLARQLKQQNYRILSETRTEADLKIKAIDEQYEAALSELKNMSDAAEELAAEIATLREQQKEHTRNEERRSLVARYESERASLEGQSKRLTEALAALDNYKANMCKDLPIEGLDITDNVVKVNGVPWNQINTAHQYRVAIKVATLRQKSKGITPIVVVDGAEQLDATRFKELENELNDSGAIAFMARVANVPFQVVTGPGALDKIVD